MIEIEESMLVRLAGVRAYGQGLHCFEILRGQLDEAESLNIVNAVEWIERGRLGDVFTVKFYKDLDLRMYYLVWSWAGVLRSDTGTSV